MHILGIKKVNISTFLTLAIMFLHCIIGLIFIFLANQQLKKQALTEAEIKAGILLDHNLAIHTYFSHQLKPKLFELTASFNPPLSADYFDPTWMSSTYAVREIGKYFKEFSDDPYYYKECAVNARHPENEADGYERRFLETLNADQDLERISAIRDIDGRQYFTTLRRGEKMEASCLRCHSAPENAPGEMVKRYGPVGSFHRKIGATVSAISLRVPLGSPLSEAHSFSMRLSALLVAALAALVIIQLLLFRYFLFAPMTRIREEITLIAERREHLGKEILPPFGRELNEMARAFNMMSANLLESRKSLEDKNERLVEANQSLGKEVQKRFKAEADLKRHQGRLEADVSERTDALRKANEQLETEISIRKRTEATLKESKENLSLIVSHMPAAVIAHNAEGDIVFANATAEKYTGYTVSELLNLNISDLDRQIDLREDQELIWRQMEYGGRKKLKSEHIRKDGSKYQVEIHITSMTFKHEPVILGIVQDITERTQAEAALQESEEKFSKAFHAAPVTMSISTMDQGVFLDVNAEFLKISGFTRAEIIGKKSLELGLWPDSEPRAALLSEIKRKGFVHNKETELVAKSGKIVPLLFFADAVNINNQQCLIVIGYDLTERRNTEKKLKQYSERLEDMVQERTCELEKAQEELLVKERLAVLGHFSGSISHELLNPLAAIDASAYYLDSKLGGHDEGLRECVCRIRSNVKKSSAIIQSLLNLSRMEKPKTQARDICEIINESLCSSRIPNTVEVRLDFPEDHVFVDVDPEQARMALKNIINNAVQAMDGTGLLEIGARFGIRNGYPACDEHRTEKAGSQESPDMSDKNRMVEISVSDTGPGILPEHIEKVFEPLFTTKTHGIGFGLSITKMIIENHGGMIKVESAYGQGTTFRLSLPVNTENRMS